MAVAGDLHNRGIGMLLEHLISLAPRLPGRRGNQAADLAALQDMLLRVSRMVDDLPQIAELELSPVIARPDGVQAGRSFIRDQWPWRALRVRPILRRNVAEGERASHPRARRLSEL